MLRWVLEHHPHRPLELGAPPLGRSMSTKLPRGTAVRVREVGCKDPASGAQRTRKSVDAYLSEVGRVAFP